MIYFTEITKEATKAIVFEFYPKELPESISIKRRTKLNKIEYNGGVLSNQIIGVFREPVEWEGCFFGTYTEGGKVINAKQRADKLKKLQGRQIRCVFAVPSTDSGIPGITSAGKAGNNEEKAPSGESGIYIIEELDFTIHNYADVDYRIKLVPDTVQKKIKPKDVSVQAVKIRPDVVRNSEGEILGAEPITAKGKADATKAQNEAVSSSELVRENLERQRKKRAQEAIQKQQNKDPKLKIIPVPPSNLPTTGVPPGAPNPRRS